MAFRTAIFAAGLAMVNAAMNPDLTNPCRESCMVQIHGSDYAKTLEELTANSGNVGLVCDSDGCVADANGDLPSGCGYNDLDSGCRICVENQNTVDGTFSGLDLKAISTCGGLATATYAWKYADQDIDGLADVDEQDPPTGIREFMTSPYKADTDNDGISDLDEMTNTYPKDPVPDGEVDPGCPGFSQTAENQTARSFVDGTGASVCKTSPTTGDTDSDGIKDAAEIKGYRISAHATVCAAMAAKYADLLTEDAQAAWTAPGISWKVYENDQAYPDGCYLLSNPTSRLSLSLLNPKPDDCDTDMCVLQAYLQEAATTEALMEQASSQTWDKTVDETADDDWNDDEVDTGKTSTSSDATKDDDTGDDDNGKADDTDADSNGSSGSSSGLSGGAKAGIAIACILGVAILVGGFAVHKKRSAGAKGAPKAMPVATATAAPVAASAV